MESRTLKAIKPLAIGLGLITLFGLSQNIVRNWGAAGTAVVELPPAYIGTSINPKVIRRFLGLNVLAADLVWIDTMIKSDITHEEMPYTSIYHAFKTITELDPDNMVAYYIGGLYLSVIKDDIKGASAILYDGVHRLDSHPEDHFAWLNVWRIPFMLGFNLMYEEHDFVEGAKWIRKISEYPNVPDAVRRFSDHVQTERGVLEIGGRILAESLRNATRQDVQERIRAKMVLLAVRSELLDLNEKFEAYLKTTDAQTLSKKRAFANFLKSIAHSGKDLRGHPLLLNSAGKIEVSE